MKKYYFLFSFVIITLFLAASPEKIVVIDPSAQHDHGEYYDPADKPEVYYDDDNQEIIRVGDGFASYYDVSIISVSTMSLVHYEQVSGYGGSIDISSLPNDNYKIVIISSYNNMYEGFFTNY